MEFIDHTGHIFSLKSFSSEPIGYQWTINKYVFWMNNPTETHKLSIDRYYFKSVYPVFDIKGRGEIESVEIKIHESNTYHLVSPVKIQSLIEENKLITDDINLDSSSFVNSLNKDDLVIAKVHEDKNSVLMMCPFYVIGKTSIEGSILTNIIIHVDYEDGSQEWCPITVGGEWYDENEPLVINGKNMGIDLPKDILKAVYDCSYFDDVPDYTEWNEKMKELLMSYMHIKGECGNYNSAIDSLRWFGYGDKIEISSLLKTDNQFLAQYILDQFSLDSDIIQAYKKFKQTAYISLYLDDNEETDKIDWQDFDKEFFGEGKPFTEDLFSKLVPIYHDENDLPFWKPYYDWSFNEMGLKLAILKHMYKKYFLPMHLSVHTSSLRHRVFTNDVKMMVASSAKETATPILVGGGTSVRFDDDVIYIYNQVHYLDTCYNDIQGYAKLGTETNEQILYINDICASLPIYFLSDVDEQVFNCHLLLFKENVKVLETDFSFMQKKDEKKYNSLVIIPKQLNYSKSYNYWINKPYRIALMCNGHWYYHDFEIKMPEMHLGFGKLEYEYITNDNITYIDYEEGDPGYLSPDDPDYYEGCNHVQVNDSVTYHNQINKITDDIVDFNSFMYVPSLVEVADMTFFDRLTKMVDFYQWDNKNNVSLSEYCDNIASKCYIYNIGLGLNSKNNTYYPGDPIVPMFYFNNGTLTDNGAFKLSEYIVDIYFDYREDGTYYAKATFDLLGEIKDWDQAFDPSYFNYIEYPNYKLGQIISNKEAVGVSSIYYETITNNGTGYKLKDDITYEEKKKWAQVYVDGVLRNRESIIIKFVISGKIKVSSNNYYEFGGYDKYGHPVSDSRFNIDYLINISRTGSNSSKCEMDCKVKYCLKNCIYRQSAKTDTYNKKPHETEEAPGTQEQQQIVSSNVISGLNRLISDANQSWSTVKLEKYYNRIHIYNINLLSTDNKDVYGNPSKKNWWKYDPLLDANLDMDSSLPVQSPELVTIYRTFFNDDGTSKVSIDKDNMFEYDFYLMHDDDYWFGVFISKVPISYKIYANELEAPNTFEYGEETKFKFVKYKSDSRILINRLKYIDAYPTYHFSSDDIILATIDNVKFPFIPPMGSKWNITPFSLGVSNDKYNITANTNSAIISIGSGTNALANGYYDVSVEYSVDGNVQHQQIKKARILIK